MKDWLQIFWQDKKAATAVEYGLICTLIVIAAIGGMNQFGNKSDEMWDYVGNKITGE